MLRKHFLLSVLLTVAFGTGSAFAAVQNLTLSPGNTQAYLHARSAVTDVDGTFSEVSGHLDYDLEHQTCHVDLTMDVSSLKVGSAVMKQIMLSGIMLDSDAHPTMHYVGDCRPRVVNGQVQGQLVGMLTMRGQTHPVTFASRMQFSGNTLRRIVSTATFDQRKWGVSTLLRSVNPMVRSETVIELK